MGNAATRLSLFLALLLVASVCSAQRIVRWTEGPGELGLGYPVPIPQSTPLPFDGFRSYFALLSRHMDLANTRADITNYIIGNTEAGRDIHMYVMSDLDTLTMDGRIEGSMLINGGMHAREWQSQEVVTGVLELLADQGEDQYFYQYLMENVNIAVIPVLNIDGFLQTQRFPLASYLDSIPQATINFPRDGRMRRKNMRDVDEVLDTADDHLLGVDLNRNHPPFWATSPRSSDDPESGVYHGEGPFSEGETLGLANAPNMLIPGSDDLSIGDRLRLYFDIHSFSRVIVPTANMTEALIANQQSVADTFSNHHNNIPDGRFYAITPLPTLDTGVGFSPEYFADEFMIPSFTVEMEPLFPDGGAEYGGFGGFGSGFVLPESDIRRVRENMSATLAATAYHQAGPPAIQRIRVIKADSGALLFQSQQQRLSANQLTREVLDLQTQDLQPGQNYQMEISFDKPMRWLDNDNNIVAFPGQSEDTLGLNLALETPGGNLDITTENIQWPLDSGFFSGGFRYYMTDTVVISFSIDDSTANSQLINNQIDASIAVTTTDMVGFGLDSNPATPIDFQNGDWTNYELEPAQGSIGSTDRSINIAVSTEQQDAIYSIDNSVSGTWQSLSQNGIGYIIERLPDGRVAVSWATYDEQGNQRWLVGVGQVIGNRIAVDNLSFATGPSFGPDFNPADVVRQTQVGSLEFTLTDCNAGSANFDAFGQSGQFDDFVPTTQIAGIGCQIDNVQLPPLAFASGTWFDLTHNGEGFTIHVLPDGRVIVYWYTFDSEGNQVWLIGVGTVDTNNRIVIDNMRTTTGALFGNDFDQNDVVRTDWGQVIIDLNCDQGTAMYNSSLPAFGSGLLNLSRLTTIAGINCPQ